jgi:hypothetical protein
LGNRKIGALIHDEVFTECVQGDRPIYHYHIRKTAGTSINMAFISSLTSRNAYDVYENLAETKHHYVRANNKIIVGWNRKLIEKGCYHYGFSHLPIHQVEVPENAIRFTCFRDPLKRVLSHYNMLMYYKTNKINHPCMIEEGKWIKDGMKSFVNEVPETHLLNQLFMFSSSFSIEEAAAHVNSLDFIMTTERLENDIQAFSMTLGMNLNLTREKSFGYKDVVDSDLMIILRKRLQKEYDFIEKLNLPSKV